MRFIRVLALFAVAATLACGDDDTTDPGNGNGDDDFTVSVGNNVFNPSTISVPVNSTVSWQWNSGGIAHNVTFEDAAPGSGDRTTGSFDRTFSATGDYAYVCTLHAGMAGNVSVTAGTTGGTGNGGTGDGGGGGAYP